MANQPQVPDYRHYFNPILRSLKALGGSASIEKPNSRAAAEVKLSDAVLAVPHDKEHGGQSEVAYRMAWARYYLKTAGLITNSERAVWSLTPAGVKAGEIDEKALAKAVQAKKKRARKPEHDDEGVGEGDEESEEAWKHTALEAMYSMPADGG